jgi:hypothetical protein
VTPGTGPAGRDGGQLVRARARGHGRSAARRAPAGAKAERPDRQR